MPRNHDYSMSNSNLADEIQFKVGRFVTPRKFWPFKFILTKPTFGFGFWSSDFAPLFSSTIFETQSSLKWFFFSLNYKTQNPSFPKEVCQYHLQKFSRNSGRIPNQYITQICKNISYLVKKYLTFSLFCFLPKTPNIFESLLNDFSFSSKLPK